jgi:hypothetical protein
MLAEITNDGFVKITAENPAEAFALQHIYSDKEICPSCGQVKQATIIDLGVIAKSLEINPDNIPPEGGYPGKVTYRG